MVKIAFSGKCTSGKSTAANMVKEVIKDTHLLSFAGKIKELAKDLFGMEEKNRPLLIDLGTKMREINKDVWLDYVLKTSEKYDNVVIDDLRFKNEFSALKKAGFILVRLEIDQETQIKRLIKLYPTTWKEQVERLGDSTEIDLDNTKFDYHVNSTNFEDVKNVIKSIAENN